MSALAETLRRLRRWWIRLALSLAGRAWKPRPAEVVRRIVVVEMTRLGDLVAATALLEPLRLAYPGATLELLGDAAYAALFEGSELVYHGLPGQGGAFLAALLKLQERLKGGDVLLAAASPALRNSLVVLASSPGRACGYLFPEAGGLEYDAPAPLQALGGGWAGRDRSVKGAHMVSRAALVLRVAGLPWEALAPRVHAAAPRDSRKVLLHAGSNWDRRRWPLDRFAALAASLAGQGWRVTLMPAEAGPLPAPPDGVRVLTATSLSELREELASAALFIGNDSGPLHLAAALGTPCLALFGPNLVERSGPWPLPGPASPHRALWEEVPCRPCAQVRCVQPWDWCMGKLPVERVLREALASLHAEAQA